MKVIIKKKEMREAIKNIIPNRIAVAYVGNNTESFIDNYDLVDAIIVRPTLGTNPYEVEKIADIIGWDRIFLLTTLHAKIYLGIRSVLFGSCNLSHNGLGDFGLHEIAAYSDAPQTVKKISGYFDRLLYLANEEYPDNNSKKNIIEQLKRDAPLSIIDPISNIINIPIIWWTRDLEKITPEGLEKYGADSDIDFNDNICEEALSITNDCIVRPGQFILQWQIRNNGTAVKNSLKWLYVHAVEKHFIFDDIYSGCAIQLAGVKAPIPPFDIENKKFRDAFADLMARKPESYTLKDQNSDAWVVSETIMAESRLFLHEIREMLKVN